MMSSLFIGATGLKGHSEGMSVISHNLANVNTVGYKQTSLEFADLVSQYVTAASANITNMNQKGSGVMPNETRTLFIQGGLETGSAATDMCITGIGFFGVSKDSQTHYTRAGDFRFTKEGELVDPNGWVVLGRAIKDGVEDSAATPIILDLSDSGQGFMPARATSTVTSVARLGGLTDNSADPANPFFSMAANWNANQTPPLGSSKYGYRDSVQFYDSNGNMQTATIYYDKAGTTGGLTAIEYVLAMTPEKDDSGQTLPQAEGLLMAGTMTFSSNGALANLTAFSPPGSGDPADLAGWTPAPLVNGQPAFTVQPAGAEAQTIALDTGYVFGSGSAGGGLASAAEAAADPSSIYRVDTSKTLKEKSSTGVGELPGTMYSASDGYAEGYLRDMHVSADGMARGTYSNGQSQDLFRVVVYRFTSQDGLRHEGHNHYAATPDSGPAEEGTPGDENFGTIAEYALEQSNVDYAREFSRMIITQRGFQMNSKVITTSDTMLQKALELKR